MRTHFPPTPASERQYGFTLVEVVIAVSITAVLMLALWSLLSMYLNVSTKSERRVTRSQLTRSLQQQIERDLQLVYYRPSRSPRSLEEMPVVDADGSAFPPEPFETTEYEFDTDDEEPGFASSFDEIDFEQEDVSIDGDVIYDLTQRLWSEQDVVMKANAYSLVLDHPQRAEPRRELRVQQHADPNHHDFRPPSELLYRTVYVFIDRQEALSKGFPPGLLRVTLLPHELERIRKDAKSDMFQIIEGAKPDLFKKTEFTDQWRDDESKFKDARTTALEELNRSLGRTHLLDHNFANRVDYIPEIKSFRLRFFDGTRWTDRWDVKQQRRLPQTVELSFEIDLDLPQEV